MGTLWSESRQQGLVFKVFIQDVAHGVPGKQAVTPRCQGVAAFSGICFFDGSLSGCWGLGSGGRWVVEDRHETTIVRRGLRGK